MTRKKLRPRRGQAVEVSGMVSVQQQSDTTPTPLALQAAFIARRLGGMDPATIAAIAALAFGAGASR